MRWWGISPERVPNGGVHAIATGFQLETRWRLAWESWYSTNTTRICLYIFVFQYFRIFVFSSLDKMAFSLRKLELNRQQTDVISTQGAIKVSPSTLSWWYQCFSRLKYRFISIKISKGYNSFFWIFVWKICNNSI